MTIFDIKKAHLIGIGGISMCSIAYILLERGIEVTGSDQNKSDITMDLEKAGATVYLGHNANNITDQDIVIYTGAVGKENPEIIEAISKNIPTIARTEALNDILQLHKNIIAVSGTHGKTTTTSMLTHILREKFDDISYMIGAHLAATGKSYNLIDEEFITVEACEYQANFLKLFPTSLIINNIEPEHMDYYKSIEQLVSTFRAFAHNLPYEGKLILNIDDVNCRKLLDESNYQITTYSTKQKADYRANNITSKDGTTSFDLVIKGKVTRKINLRLLGDYNVSNALAAIAAAELHGIDLDTISNALASFVNSDRRFEHIGCFEGASVISDYAHHPSEVKASISGTSSINDKKIVLVFQPHTYSRTKTMLNEFAEAFKGVDELYITDIYAAREENIYNIHSTDLVEAISGTGQKVEYLGPLDNIKTTLKGKINENCLLIMMGAGSIDNYARKSLVE